VDDAPGSWWRAPLRQLVDGGLVIVVGGPAVFWTRIVPVLRELGAADVLVVGTEGMGVGPPPDASSVIVERPPGHDFMTSVRHAVAAIGDPPPHVLDAVESFDPECRAVVFGSFLAESPALAGRPLVAHRRPEWVALEDKTRVDALLDRAGVDRAPAAVVDLRRACGTWRDVDRGSGTVWAADARDGYHGGAARTRWVTDDAEAAAVTEELAAHCDRVRVMPFLEGIATSVHGIVLPDGVACLRPVELVTLRRGRELRYSGCATFWDPPAAVREEMRVAARRVGELLRAEVDFRGAFTLDGVATADGFRPTELNPRFGAGLGVITRGLEDLPLHLVLDLVVGGIALPLTAAALEAEILAEADARRSGASWQLRVDTPVAIDGRAVGYRDGEWRWAEPEDPAEGSVMAGEGFARVGFDADRTPVGPSVGPRAAAFWRFADAELGTNIGRLEAPVDVLA
jgi:hypothetical protein